MSDWLGISTRIRLGAILWLLCFQYFVAEQIARLAWKIPYSMTRNFISDLGAVHCFLTGAEAVCSPLHALMNTSLILQGLLIFFGGLLVRKLYPPGRLITLAISAIVLSGIGLFLVGLAPEDVNPGLHYAAAAEHFLLDNLGMVLLGIALLLRKPAIRNAGIYALVSGLVGLTATLLLAQKIFLGCGVGGMERIASYPFPLWLTMTGVSLVFHPNVSKLDPPQV